MILKSSIASSILLLLIGAILYISFFANHPALPAISNSINAPDAFMEDVNALIMDKDGKLNLKITAPKLIHFNKDDESQLTSPVITLYRQSPMPWLITSKFANATDGIDNVKFKENVVIRHANDITTPETVIKTNTLLVHTNKKTAETNDRITMLQPNLTVKSIGMFADMNSGDIKLLSQVRGEYVPNT